MDRRNFLGLVTAGSAGLYLERLGLIELSRKLVLEYAGSCSFCGKNVREVFGLAGLQRGGPVRICDQCIGLCLDIIAEEQHKLRNPPVPPPPPTPRTTASADVLAKTRSELEEMIGAELEEQRSKTPSQRNIQLACSFCDKSQREVAKLIAGPAVYICDGCIGDASSLFISARPSRGSPGLRT